MTLVLVTVGFRSHCPFQIGTILSYQVHISEGSEKWTINQERLKIKDS